MTQSRPEDATPPCLSDDALAKALQGTLANWTLDRTEGTALLRRVTVKGFAKAVYLTNLATFLADQSGHHPDLRLGWGYFEIRFTTHDAGGVTETDLACAHRFDALLAPE